MSVLVYVGYLMSVLGADLVAHTRFQYLRHQPPWKGRIPLETDVLVTHAPPASIPVFFPASHLTNISSQRYHLDLNLGCAGLLEEIWRVKPKLHVFGHVHWGHGRQSVYYDQCQRAYETLMSRPKKGPLHDFFPNSNWKEAFKVVFYGINSILWKWLMLGPGSNNAGLMVNAALMYGNTGKMGNTVEVVNL